MLLIFAWALKKIHIPSDSKLQIIDQFSFYDSAITSISIPSSVTSIGRYAFNNTKKLLIVEINNPELISMIDEAFITSDALFMISAQS